MNKKINVTINAIDGSDIKPESGDAVVAPYITTPSSIQRSGYKYTTYIQCISII